MRQRRTAQGATTDLEISSRDPSAPHFCLHLGASPGLLSAPPQATHARGQLAQSDGFSLDKCRRIAEGIDGYLDSRPLCATAAALCVALAATLATLVLLELILAFNLLATLYTKAAQTRKASAAYYNNRPVYTESV